MSLESISLSLSTDEGMSILRNVDSILQGPGGECFHWANAAESVGAMEMDAWLKVWLETPFEDLKG